MAGPDHGYGCARNANKVYSDVNDNSISNGSPRTIGSALVRYAKMNSSRRNWIVGRVLRSRGEMVVVLAVAMWYVGNYFSLSGNCFSTYKIDIFLIFLAGAACLRFIWLLLLFFIIIPWLVIRCCYCSVHTNNENDDADLSPSVACPLAEATHFIALHSRIHLR